MNMGKGGAVFGPLTAHVSKTAWKHFTLYKRERREPVVYGHVNGIIAPRRKENKR